MNILFVCLGNICRSPMAEAIMRDVIKQHDLTEKVTVDSAGTGNWHIGEPPHKGTLAKLKEYGIAANHMTCRQLQKSDLNKFDYIIGMDTSNVATIRTMLASHDDAKIFRFLDLTEHQKDVPDPWFTGNFQETYDLCLAGCQALMKRILKEIH